MKIDETIFHRREIVALLSLDASVSRECPIVLEFLHHLHGSDWVHGEGFGRFVPTAAQAMLPIAKTTIWRVSSSGTNRTDRHRILQIVEIIQG